MLHNPTVAAFGRRVFSMVAAATAVHLACAGGRADESAPLELRHPAPFQVVQRIGVSPGEGFADVSLRGDLPASIGAEDKLSWEYRVVAASKEPEVGVDVEWKTLHAKLKGVAFEGAARVEAGGWQRLEVRCRANGRVVASAAVAPIGVGEVFLVAGQSYATNCNDEQLKVADAEGRVVAFDAAKRSWAVAHDPQPAPDGSDGGSIWPPLGDALAGELKVPIGFVNVAVGATSSQQWMPEGKLHPWMVATGKDVGAFRAVLWQQGESDVIAKTSTERYVSNLREIRESAAKQWGFEPPWLLAKSTHHPTVYSDAAGEDRIRSAIDALATRPGFRAGPDTDTLRGENRGDVGSRRHFSGVGQRRAAAMWLAAIRREFFVDAPASGELRVGVAESDITPPLGFPMAGYYHERLAEGTIDPLKAKALVLREGDTAAALVVCDLIGIATDLSREVRRRASEKTGIPAANIVIAATHSHTAPDYMKELCLYLGKEKQERLRSDYIEKLIGGPVDAIGRAAAAAQPAALAAGVAIQKTPVAFNRRFVMRDGSVRTWQNLTNPEVVRAAGPIDPQIGLLTIRDPAGAMRGIFSNFALHLDTVGGMRWSADYPFFIEESLRRATGAEVVSIFGAGCCGDINHSDPSRRERNKADFIGGSIGETIQGQLVRLKPVERTALTVKSQTVRLPLQDATEEEVERAVQIVELARRGEKVEFFDHVTAYKKLILDQLRHPAPFAKPAEHLTWGLSRSLAGVGESLPVEVTVMTIGEDVAIVCLPGEVFVELGLAIKQGSPYRTTLIVELSNAVETIYVPNRAAYAGGSYEVTNSALQPGGGEMLVEAALRLLREAATEAAARLKSE